VVRVSHFHHIMANIATLCHCFRGALRRRCRCLVFNIVLLMLCSSPTPLARTQTGQLVVRQGLDQLKHELAYCSSIRLDSGIRSTSFTDNNRKSDNGIRDTCGETRAETGAHKCVTLLSSPQYGTDTKYGFGPQRDFLRHEATLANMGRRLTPTSLRRDFRISDSMLRLVSSSSVQI